MKRSETQARSMVGGSVKFHGAVQGAGAAAPVIPTTTLSTTSSKLYMAVSVNCISATAGDITRGGVGAYTAKIKEDLAVPVILDIIATCWGADSKRVQVQDYNPTTRIITFAVTTAAGVAADLAATDAVKFNIEATVDVPVY